MRKPIPVLGNAPLLHANTTNMVGQPRKRWIVIRMTNIQPLLHYSSVTLSLVHTDQNVSRIASNTWRKPTVGSTLDRRTTERTDLLHLLSSPMVFLLLRILSFTPQAATQTLNLHSSLMMRCSMRIPHCTPPTTAWTSLAQHTLLK